MFTASQEKFTYSSQGIEVSSVNIFKHQKKSYAQDIVERIHSLEVYETV